MKTIVTLARREITRLKTRFSGKSRALVLGVLVVTIISALVMYHQDFAVSKGLYTIGVSSNSPILEDSRFIFREMEPEQGYHRVNTGEIDVYLHGTVMFTGNTEKAENAASALRKSLQRLDLLRVAAEYPLQEAFPLRIEVSYVGSTTDALVQSAIASAIPDEEQGLSGQPSTEPGQPSTEPGQTGAVLPGNASPAEVPAPALSDPDTPVHSDTSSVAPPGESESRQPPTVVDARPAYVAAATDEAVRKQLEEFAKGGALPEFKAEFVSESDIIIPSLTNPPIPLAQVIITFFYIVPVFFISLFFTSSFTEEKISRRLLILLSAPVTRLQVIIGKMLPYLAYSILVIIGVTLALGGNVLLGLAVFTPVMLFIFAIYLMVALTYRTFKDQTFFSVLALSIVTVYLVGPAMFTGVNDLSYISPLTLAVQMFRGETFTAGQYFLATTPLLLVFGQSMYVGTRVMNEEYLMGFRPLHRKVAEAIAMTIDKAHLNLSMLFMGASMVPVVFMIQLSIIALVSNLPVPFMLGIVLIGSVFIEEIAKSVSVVILLQNRTITGVRKAAVLAILAAAAFFFVEKLLLLVVMSVVTDSTFVLALSGGGLLLLPLTLHVVTTVIVCSITAKVGTKYYPLALLAGSVAHLMYNIAVAGGTLL